MYLGIDQSLQSSGITVLDGDTNDPVLTHVVKTGQSRGAERLALIRDFVRTVIDQFHPCYAALEGYSMESMNRSFDMGELGGVIRLTLYETRTPFLIVPPSSLKLFVAGNGQAKKEKVQGAIAEKWGVKIDQNDIADAYGLAQVARAFHKQNSTVRHELEVIHQLSSKKKELPLVSKGRTKIST